MGTGYSKAYKRKILRFLITFSVILFGLSYILHNRRQAVLSEQSTASPGRTLEDIKAHIDEVSQLRQQQQRLDSGKITPENDDVSPIPIPTLNQQETEGSDKPEKRKKADIGKITVSFGMRDETCERAIRSHELHNEKMGYTQFVLREKIMHGLYSKHAFIFSVIAQELAKPEEERLKWVMWLDRDTVLMNPLLRLEDFLPPPGFENIYLLATNDRNGLNNGIFMLRVNDWALNFFAAAMAMRHYLPDIPLKYSEQSAMEEVLKHSWYNQSLAMVPQHWFNSFNPPTNGKAGKQHATPGSLLMHFASNRDGNRPERMNLWIDVADEQRLEWTVPIEKTFYPAQFEEYWRRRGDGEDVGTIIGDLERRPR